MARPIPEGMHTATPHLVVDGAARAIDFYKAAFGAVEHNRMPAGGGKLGHAHLQIGDSAIFLADRFPGAASPRQLKGSPVTIHLYVEDCDSTFARAVGAGAKVKMPLMDMFWGDRYGQVVDPFGHLWSIATHKEDVSPEEMARRGAEAMAAMAAAPRKKAPRRKAARKARPARSSRKGRAKK